MFDSFCQAELGRAANSRRVNDLGQVLERAFDNALINEPEKREEEETKKILKKKGGKGVQKIKESLQKVRKPRMRTVEHYLCDQCDRAIMQASDGFIIHGNVYVADPSCRGGLIGNNFPEVEEGQTITPDAIKETVLCKTCMMLALGFIGDNSIHNPSVSRDDKKLISKIAGALARESPRDRDRRWEVGEDAGARVPVDSDLSARDFL